MGAEEGGVAATRIMAELEEVLRSRKAEAPEGSYSATLLADPERATRKIVEEAYELCVELLRPVPDPERAASEAADVLFHVLAGLVGAGVGLDAVMEELDRRRGRSGSEEASADR